jgi:hypothetical protein
VTRNIRRSLGSVLPVLCAAAMTLAACSSSGPSASGTPTGTSTASQAAAILNHAKQAPLKDATFSFVLGTASSPTSATPTASTSGSGRLTTNPARTDLMFTGVQVQGFATSAEVIVDQATGTYYVNVPALSSQWLKVDPASLGVDIGVVTILDYDGLQNLTLVGTETINGVATWHIQGTKQITKTIAQGNVSITRTEDYWFRQSDYYPMKIAFQDVVNGAISGSGTSTPTAGPTTTAPSPTPTSAVAPSIDVSQTTTPSPSPTGTSAQVTLIETFTFSAWDKGFTISLPTNVVGG